MCDKSLVTIAKNYCAHSDKDLDKPNVINKIDNYGTGSMLSRLKLKNCARETVQYIRKSATMLFQRIGGDKRLHFL